MIDKKNKRLKRARKARMNMRKHETVRLVVHKTHNHMYAQVISACGAKVLAAASTLEAEIKSALPHRGNCKAAAQVGALVAKRAISAGIKKVGFDRSGFRYQGRVKALAEAAREGGVEF